MLGKIDPTYRGFERIEFIDLYGKVCSIQQSSLALTDVPGASAVWIGVDGSRMHLDVNQVESLIFHLQAWVETGSFELE